MKRIFFLAALLLLGACDGNDSEGEPEVVPGSSARLVFCGENRVCMIDAARADASGYENALIWSWDAASAAETLGIDASRCDHLDDCKPYDNGARLLLTSSYGWCVLLDTERNEILFHTTASANAHSAELLPEDRVVVACSTGNGASNNILQLYDLDTPDRVLAQVPLESAHGVVWNATTQRLYAIGGQSLQIYRLEAWESDSPQLVLEKNFRTPQSGVHDLTFVDGRTLCVAGRQAYLYNIESNLFTEMLLFSSSTAIKSLNYNAETGEMWYTDATTPEGSQSWSTRTIRYATNRNGSSSLRTIRVPDLDMYKVRVVAW